MTLAETIAHLVALYQTDPVLKQVGPMLTLNVMGTDGDEHALHGGASAIVLRRVGIGNPNEPEGTVRVSLLDAGGQLHEWRPDKLSELRPSDVPRTAVKRWRDYLAERAAQSAANYDSTGVGD